MTWYCRLKLLSQIVMAATVLSGSSSSAPQLLGHEIGGMNEPSALLIEWPRNIDAKDFTHELLVKVADQIVKADVRQFNQRADPNKEVAYCIEYKNYSLLRESTGEIQQLLTRFGLQDAVATSQVIDCTDLVYYWHSPPLKPRTTL